MRNDVLAFPYGAFSRPLLQVCRNLGIDVTLTVKAGINGPDQHNGFRLNAGGEDNNPDLMIALMKQAPKLLGRSHFQEPSKKFDLLMLPIALLFLAVLWGRSLWDLLEQRRMGKKLLLGDQE